jgi:FtsZ-binding cell division protein ZapB
MPKLRGRAASAVRVGQVIKNVLSGKLPNEEGKLVTESAIVDIHHVYKKLIKDNNATRSKKLKPMVYSSFITQFRFAEKLNLVELVRKEPMLFPPPTGHLYTFKVHDGNIGEISQRHVYRLTSIGEQDEKSWTNLTQAFIQHWVAPQAAPEYEVVPKVYVHQLIPSVSSFTRLRNHLISGNVTKVEADRIAEQVGDWIIYLQDRAEVSGRAEYTKLADSVNTLYEYLAANKIKESIDLISIMIINLEKLHEKVQPTAEEHTVKENKVEEPETLQETLHNLMDSTKQSKSIDKLRSALDELDHDKFEGIADVEGAIEDYESIERAGLTSAEYGEDRQAAFDEIDDAIDAIKEVDESEE